MKPSDISRENYDFWVGEYGVLNTPVPPLDNIEVSWFAASDRQSEDSTGIGKADKITIPQLYEAFHATVHSDKGWSGLEPFLKVFIGGVEFDHSGAGSRVTDDALKGDVANEISIGLIATNVREYAVSVDIQCKLKDQGLKDWQHKMYDAIMNAYLAKKQEYEQKIAVAEIQQGIPILGRNPIENRRIEREELKKLSMAMLKGIDLTGFESIDPKNVDDPDLENIVEQGLRLRFFEHAFEWNNLMYVFYPYFWTTENSWKEAILLTNEADPNFAAFLKAGAARVQVPVRPGFEEAITFYCNTGQIWMGSDDDIPNIGDDFYLPIANEIAENLGKIEDGVPESDPWEVVVPTSLVLVQNLEEIPGIVDPLTESEVEIQNG